MCEQSSAIYGKLSAATMIIYYEAAVPHTLMAVRFSPQSALNFIRYIMASDLRVLYFSDQTVDLLESLSRLSSLSRKSSILTNFLQSAIDVINHASTELPLPERNIFPVKHLEELSQWQHELKLKNAAVYGSILCTAQIGWWLM